MARGSFGWRLAELRGAANLNQTALGERIGVDQRRISAWEKGLNLPPPDKIPILARVLCADPQELFELLAEASAADAAESRRDLNEALRQIQRFVDTYQAFHAAYETMGNQIDRQGRQIDQLVDDVADLKAVVHRLLPPDNTRGRPVRR
jgi:transcriptional regulator with XRE-family HTH domain